MDTGGFLLAPVLLPLGFAAAVAGLWFIVKCARCAVSQDVRADFRRHPVKHAAWGVLTLLFSAFAIFMFVVSSGHHPHGW